MTTTFDIDEIERLLAAAEPGPWQTIGTDPAEGGDWFWIMAQPSPALRGFTKELGVVNGSQSDPQKHANAALIVTLHNSAPAMIAELRELRAENARLREALETIRDRKWNTMTQGCDAAAEAAQIAGAALTGEPQ